MNLLAVAVAVCVVFSIGYLFYLSEFHNAKPWRVEKAHFLELAESYGLKPDPSTHRATGALSGLPFSMGLKSSRGSKAKQVLLWAKLELPGDSFGLTLRNESFWSGLAKSVGPEELSLGDPEFDAAFVVHGDSVEQWESFLTPERRSGLLHYFSQLPRASLKDQAVYSGVSFNTPFFLRKKLVRLLDNNRHLAKAMQGESTVLPMGETSGLVAGKLRKFAWVTLPVWGTLALVSTQASSAPSDRALQFLFFTYALATLGVFFIPHTARVLLQGLYAFLSAFAVVLLIVGGLHGLEIYEPRWFHIDQEYGAFFTLTVIAGVLTWGARNYLKTLNQTLAVVKEPEANSKLGL